MQRIRLPLRRRVQMRRALVAAIEREESEQRAARARIAEMAATLNERRERRS